jgi:hypothetical protein
MFMIMTDNEKTTKTPAKNGADLRDSIVQRLKAHDAAIFFPSFSPRSSGAVVTVNLKTRLLPMQSRFLLVLRWVAASVRPPQIKMECAQCPMTA